MDIQKIKRGNQYDGMVTEVDFPIKGKVKIQCEAGGTPSPDTESCPVLTVKGVLPGQRVRVQAKKNHKGNAQGNLTEVLSPSPLEDATDTCPHFGRCGGCSYQTMSYANQLSYKASQVKKLLDTVCSDYAFQPILPSPKQWEYRNKMEFSFGDEVKDGPLTLGLHRKNSFYDILDVAGCRIIHPDFDTIRNATQKYFSDLRIPYVNKRTHEGYLRHLLIRRGEKTGELLVALVTTSQREIDLQDFTELLLSLSLEGAITGILHIVNDSLADVVQCDAMKLLHGKEYFFDELLGLRFRISPFSFFQTNSLGAEVLYTKAREFILSGSDENALMDKTVFDLYSGTGTIAQMIAPVAKKVIGVEIVEEAVISARENAALNQLDNCEFIAGDVLKVIDTIEEKPDFIILDPPRDGIHPGALQKIIDYGVDKLVYISCKPTSLVRDLKILQEAGYRLETACPVDMFPNTVHVETVCLLSKLHADQHLDNKSAMGVAQFRREVYM